MTAYYDDIQNYRKFLLRANFDARGSGNQLQTCWENKLTGIVMVMQPARLTRYNRCLNLSVVNIIFS